jgi:formate hydrogenlyase subunit 4
MQGRIGPPLRQPFFDVGKLFIKENIVPDRAIPWLFNLVPLIGLAASCAIMLYLPLGGLPAVLSTGGDVILILYLLLVPSLAMVIGGFSSGSPYAIVGAQREMATMIAYEFPFGVIVVSLAWKLTQAGAADVFTFATLTGTPIWGVVSGPLGFLGGILLLLALLIVTPAELSKIPFDSPEAETELAGGLFAEYSGRNLAMFYLTDGVKTLAMASLVVILFFPYTLAPYLALPLAAELAVDMAFFLLKVLLVVLVSVTLVRVAVARLKIDQVVSTYWIPLTLLCFVGLIMLMWDGAVGSLIGSLW